MTTKPNLTNQLLIVTGLSGAGISTALKVLEDLGYEVFDNYPVSMIDTLLEQSNVQDKPIALGIDTRTRGFDPSSIQDVVERLEAQLVFIYADEAILQKRFTETRRRHPMAIDRPVSAGIKREQEWLYPLKTEAHVAVDTTELSIHDLRRTLEGHFKTDKDQEKLTITVMSFGFKHGLPREADLVMDVRFLQNPNWQPTLKPLTGQHKDVGAYIQKDEHFAPFLENLKALIEPLLPAYDKEGKSYLTIAIGCTGGKHRSVYTSETLKPWIEAQGYTVHLFHRDMDR